MLAEPEAVCDPPPWHPRPALAGSPRRAREAMEAGGRCQARAPGAPPTPTEQGEGGVGAGWENGLTAPAGATGGAAPRS